MKYPPVTIVATTYFPDGPDGDLRFDVFRKAVESWEEFLHYDGELHLHIADDGSKKGYAPTFRGEDATHTWQDRHGVGASLNIGFKLAFKRSPIVAAFMDDWALTQRFDLTPWVHLLLTKRTVGQVRLGPPHPNNTGHIFPMTELWQGWAMLLDFQGFAFAHRPALYHQRLFDFYGWFKEDCSAIECEQHYSDIVNNTALLVPPGGCPEIVLALPHPFKHLDSVELAYIDPKIEC